MSLENANEPRTADGAEQAASAQHRLSWWLILLVVILAAGLAAFIVFDLASYFSYTALRDHRDTVTGIVEDNYLLAALIFILVYVVVVAFSLPVAIYMSVIGGFLFGMARLVGAVHLHSIRLASYLTASVTAKRMDMAGWKGLSWTRVV